MGGDFTSNLILINKYLLISYLAPRVCFLIHLGSEEYRLPWSLLNNIDNIDLHTFGHI